MGLIIVFSFAPIGNLAQTISLIAQNYVSSYAVVQGIYYIQTADDLAGINEFMINNSGLHSYYLLDNITVKNHTPIGNDSIPFNGYFYGNGFTITIESFNMTGAKYLGCFGYCSKGSVRDLNVKLNLNNINSTEITRFGAVVANGANNFNIINCNNSTNHTIEVSCNEQAYVGGIAGNILGRVKNCINHSSIKLLCGAYVGGICGRVTSSVNSCINYGNMSSYNNNNLVRAHYIGGLFGTSTNIIDCYNFGNIDINCVVKSGDIYCGGVAGVGTNSTDCYNVGNVTSLHTQYGTNQYIGGIVGSGSSINNACNSGNVICNSNQKNTQSVGGIAGNMANASNCLNAGHVSLIMSENYETSSKTNNLAGIIAYTSGTSYSNLYNTGKIDRGITTTDNYEILGTTGTIIGKSKNTLEKLTFTNCVNLKTNKIAIYEERYLNGYLSQFVTDGPGSSYEDNVFITEQETYIKPVGNLELSGDIGIEDVRNSSKYTLEYNCKRYWLKDGAISRNDWDRSIVFEISKVGDIKKVNFIEQRDIKNATSVSYSDTVFQSSKTSEDDIGFYNMCSFIGNSVYSFVYGSSYSGVNTTYERFRNVTEGEKITEIEDISCSYYLLSDMIHDGPVHCTEYETEFCSEGLKNGKDSGGNKLVGKNIDLSIGGIGPLGFKYISASDSISVRFYFTSASFMLGSDDAGNPTDPSTGYMEDETFYYYYEIANIDCDSIGYTGKTLTSSQAQAKLTNFVQSQGWSNYGNGYIKLNSH